MVLLHELEKQGNFLFRCRSYFPLLLLLLALWVYSSMIIRNPGLFFDTSITILEILAISICLIGLIIRICTVGFTPANTSVRNKDGGQVADIVNTTGNYIIARHPLYLRNSFMWLGISVLTGDIWFLLAFSLAYWIYYECILNAEEQFLIRKFGEKFTLWASTTPAFIPIFSKWTSANLTLVGKRYLKKKRTVFLRYFFWFQLLIAGIAGLLTINGSQVRDGI